MTVAEVFGRNSSCSLPCNLPYSLPYRSTAAMPLIPHPLSMQLPTLHLSVSPLLSFIFVFYICAQLVLPNIASTDCTTQNPPIRRMHIAYIIT